MRTRKGKTGIADKVEYDSLGKKRSALWLTVGSRDLVRQALVRLAFRWNVANLTGDRSLNPNRSEQRIWPSLSASCLASKEH